MIGSPWTLANFCGSMEVKQCETVKAALDEIEFNVDPCVWKALRV